MVTPGPNSEKSILKSNPEYPGLGLVFANTKAKRKGTEGEKTIGLGMYITKMIVELHKGKIWFESEKEVGTTFFISIPISIE